MTIIPNRVVYASRDFCLEIVISGHGLSIAVLQFARAAVPCFLAFTFS